MKLPGDLPQARSSHAAAVAEEVDKLAPSDLVVDFPAEMRANNAYIVTFRSKEDLTQRLQRALTERGIPSEQLGTRIDATLSAQEAHALEITPEKNSGTEWTWKVIPREAGKHTVNLDVTLTTTLAGESHVKVFPPIAQALFVTPAPGALENVASAPWFWPAALAILIAAILLSVVVWRRAVA